MSHALENAAETSGTGRRSWELEGVSDMFLLGLVVMYLFFSLGPHGLVTYILVNQE